MIDDDDERTRRAVREERVGAQHQGRSIVQLLGIAVDRIEEGLAGQLLRRRDDLHARCLDQEAEVLRAALRRGNQARFIRRGIRCLPRRRR